MLSSIDVPVAIKYWLLIFITMTITNANAGKFFGYPETENQIKEAARTEVICAFNNVTSVCAKEKLRNMTVTRSICDQQAAMETAKGLNTALQSDGQVDAWCKLFHTLLGEPQDYSCDQNATDETVSFLRTFCIAEYIATLNGNDFPNKNVVFNSYRVVSGSRL